MTKQSSPSESRRLLADLARQHTETAIMALVEIVTDANAPPSSRVTAATALLDRGHGRPAQTVEMEAKLSGPIPFEAVFLAPLTGPNDRAQ